MYKNIPLANLYSLRLVGQILKKLSQQFYNHHFRTLSAQKLNYCNKSIVYLQHLLLQGYPNGMGLPVSQNKQLVQRHNTCISRNTQYLSHYSSQYMFDDRAGEAKKVKTQLQQQLFRKHFWSNIYKAKEQNLTPNTCSCYVNGPFFPDHFLFAKHTL